MAARRSPGPRRRRRLGPRRRRQPSVQCDDPPQQFGVTPHGPRRIAPSHPRAPAATSRAPGSGSPGTGCGPRSAARRPGHRSGARRFAVTASIPAHTGSPTRPPPDRVPRPAPPARAPSDRRDRTTTRSPSRQARPPAPRPWSPPSRPGAGSSEVHGVGWPVHGHAPVSRGPFECERVRRSLGRRHGPRTAGHGGTNSRSWSRPLRRPQRQTRLLQQPLHGAAVETDLEHAVWSWRVLLDEGGGAAAAPRWPADDPASLRPEARTAATLRASPKAARGRPPASSSAGTVAWYRATSARDGALVKAGRRATHCQGRPPRTRTCAPDQRLRRGYGGQS